MAGILAPARLAGGEPEYWGFEEPTMEGWEATGNLAGWKPAAGDVFTVKRIASLSQKIAASIGGDYWKDLPWPVGHKGAGWVTTAMYGPSDENYGDARTGTLVSKSFVTIKRVISFLVGGNEDQDRLAVELLLQAGAPGPNTVRIDGVDYEVAARETGHGKELMRRTWWDLGAPQFQNRTARIRILDNSTTGHLNVDDFRFQEAPPAEESVTLGGRSHPAVVNFENRLYDWDSPVWGFADLHTHPMSYLGFGGKVMHGPPDGGNADIPHKSSWLSLCNPNHGGWGLDNPQGNYWRQVMMAALDDAGPDPHGRGWDGDEWLQFNQWPFFTSISHQQMWYEWIKRARDGGLRVMVALCVNNQLLATVSKGDGPKDDQAVGDLQIAELKAFVLRHSDFMEIAYDPVQLRDIVRRDKLAVVIGSELDDIGNLARKADVTPGADLLSKTLVLTELRRLYANGVRYVFPIHLTDNKFGGTAIAELLLNMANKFVNGVGFEVINASASDNIEFWLDNVDFRTFLGMEGLPPDIANILIGAASAAGAALLPVILPAIEAVLHVLARSADATGMSHALIPLALIGAVQLLPPLLTMIGLDQGGVVEALIPLPGNYPIYPTKGTAPFGIRNKRGLTDLGEFAVREMMKMGMMIDLDHMSQATLEDVVEIAEGVGGGYPLNWGHNSFREMALHHRSENGRTFAQLEKLQPLGGLAGVGWENSKDGSLTKTFRDLVPNPAFSRSQVANNCAGTAKTFAQGYLVTLEQQHRMGVAFGTDIDGFVPSPGPRFGPQAAFGLGPEEIAGRTAQIKAQSNGVLYEPRHGRALTTPAFRGLAMEAGNLTGLPDTAKGYTYSVDQADFYAALNIFHWLKAEVETGSLTKDNTEHAVRVISDRLSPAYSDKYHDLDLSGGSREHIANYAHGLLAGIHDWGIGDDLKPDKTATTKIGKAIYRTKKVPGYELPSEISGDSYIRYDRLLPIWDDYQMIFGSNEPMKRCRNANTSKEWDINFEGVAHYGLVPDFLQDLRNVGLQAGDMGVLFRSAEDFARMWTRCLGSAQVVPPPPTFLSQASEVGVDDTSLDGKDVVVDGCTLTINGAHTFRSLVVMNGGMVTAPAGPDGGTGNRLELIITGDVVIESGSAIDVSGMGYRANNGPGKGVFDGSAGSGGGHGGMGGDTATGTAGGGTSGSAEEPADSGSGGGLGIGSGPFVTYLDHDDESGRLSINGIRFGSVPGEVAVGGALVNVINWGDKIIVCSIPNLGPGSAGEVVVKAGAGVSNSRYLTEWRGGVSYELRYNDPVIDPNITGTPRMKLDVALHFRADIQPYRATPDGEPANRSMIIYSAARDSTCHWLVDGGITNTLSGAVFYGETWNASGTLNAQQPVFYMLNGIIPALRMMPVEFDLQYSAAYQPETMFGLMAPGTDPDRDLKLGYAMGPAAWDSGPDPYPMAVWDPKTYALPAMDKGPTVISMIAPFPWFSIVSPSGPKCTASYHRDVFPATPGTVPPEPGGMGGGVVQLIVNGQLQLNGSIKANGVSGSGGAYPGGGGSGGSIDLTVGVLTGSGSVEANGGNGGGATAGGGGGGRIAVEGDVSSFAGDYLVSGGVGSDPGDPGTLKVVQSKGTPTLTIARTSSNMVVVSWPDSATGWVVEWTSNLTGASGAWTEVPAENYQNSAGMFSYSEPLAGRRFYRLHKRH